MKSIIAYIQGGLGNQMFIYSAARALALKSGSEVVFRPDRFLNDSFGRKFALEDFNCKYMMCKMRPIVLQKVHNGYHRAIVTAGRTRFINTIVEKEPFKHQTMPNDFLWRISLDGYWQSEQYFEGYETQIFSDFQLKNTDWILRDEMAQRIIADKNPIFLHVRSYKDIKKYSDGSYALPVSYYKNALHCMRENDSRGGTIYLFSDDLKWATVRLCDDIHRAGFECVPVTSAHDNSTIVEAYLRDFVLMSMCRHGIIADSTFSWWSGWLAERNMMNHGEKCFIIRPDKGGNNDFYPTRWIGVVL